MSKRITKKQILEMGLQKFYENELNLIEARKTEDYSNVNNISCEEIQDVLSNYRIVQ